MTHCPNCGATDFLRKSIDISNTREYNHLYGIWPLRKANGKIWLDYCVWCLFPEAYEAKDVLNLLETKGLICNCGAGKQNYCHCKCDGCKDHSI